MRVRVTIELGKRERRLIARWRNERLGETGRIASRRQCKEAIQAAVDLFLAAEARRADDETARDEGGD